jgi:Fe2+ transport system protein FeoA
MPVSLATLEPGQRGVVAGFTFVDSFTQRLMQLGFLEGTQVAVIRRAPTGDPIEVEVMGYALSLRRDEARAVLVELSPVSTSASDRR